ncbi:RNA polymerase sigma factor [Myceligenerans pegani]|uniref:RNA polymerase sigma factor n=1 Tax=Myceligenerans pegani TaxID=2776917 RepID=A0ABR9MZ41_9MICO|nr:RNA polymerase sigma factor [Myceligenerans sp. TRM 65318]MBE1876052.1 RNA polymerase sigma factor [Myceligenerans sp. TRM 65318]MBE3018323.1 RNA polymerase sigma factor [Myceligenerans sp. TRM 65318]
MSDELLVVRAQLGDRSALEELVARWQTPVWTYVRRMLDAQRADDVAQDAWLAIVRALPRLREPERFAPWLFTIVRRAVANHLRDRYASRTHQTVRDLDDLDPSDTLSDTALHDPIGGLLDRAEAVAHLADLPVPEREVLVLHYLEDLSVADCARVCDVSVGTVKSRLHRARRLLRERLEEKGMEA